MVTRILLLLPLFLGIPVRAQESNFQEKIFLTRTDRGDGPASAGSVSGRWSGTIRTASGETPFYLILQQLGPFLVGKAGGSPNPQLPIRIGILRERVASFTLDMISDIHLTLQDGHLVGGLLRLPDVRPDVQLPPETAGWDNIVGALLSAFEKADVVALGEHHQRKLDSDLRIRLIRHPDFPKKVRWIVVECGNSLYQPILDRYIRGEDISIGQLQQIWRNTTQLSGVWDSPVYADFFAAVRDVNRKLPAAKRLHVLAGDPPIDWAKVRTGADYDAFLVQRDDLPTSILRDQILSKGEKALIIYGSHHLERTGGITKALGTSHPGRVFVVDALGGSYPEYEKFEKALPSSKRPVLISLKGTPFESFSAQEILGRGAVMISGSEKFPVFPSNVTLGQAEDACVYFGATAAVEAGIEPDPAIYNGTPYQAELDRRRKVISIR